MTYTMFLYLVFTKESSESSLDLAILCPKRPFSIGRKLAIFQCHEIAQLNAQISL